MGFWLFLLLCDLLIPFIMIIVGMWTSKRPPKEINMLLGYRTTRSMKNIDTWTFAQKHCASVWVKVGWILFILSIVPHLFVIHASQNVLSILSLVLIGIQFVVLIGSVFATENALKKTFHEDGTRK